MIRERKCRNSTSDRWFSDIMLLFRLLGSVTGVAMGGSILDNQLASRLANITGQSFNTFNLEDVGSLSTPPQPTKSEVLSAFASSHFSHSSSC
jgi:hypothetical protein